MPSVGNARLGLPPHVTVVFPWVASEPEIDLQRLHRAIRGLIPFSLAFREVATFPASCGCAPARRPRAQAVRRRGRGGSPSSRSPRDSIPTGAAPDRRGMPDPAATPARATEIAEQLTPGLANVPRSGSPVPICRRSGSRAAPGGSDASAPYERQSVPGLGGLPCGATMRSTRTRRLPAGWSVTRRPR
ncbi:MAG: 2'-5' RNA ligase family protein [Candidatus Dormibacteraceae bacterium]